MSNDDFSSSPRKKQIAVIGASDPSASELQVATEVGSLLASKGVCLLSGGMGGIMEASCRGAFQSGGCTVGILPGAEGNQYLTITIKTRMDQARNVILVGSSDAVIAIGGGYGTLSEISYSSKSGIPVFGLFTWDIPGIIRCCSPDEAVQMAIGKDD